MYSFCCRSLADRSRSRDSRESEARSERSLEGSSSRSSRSSFRSGRSGSGARVFSPALGSARFRAFAARTGSALWPRSLERSRRPPSELLRGTPGRRRRGLGTLGLKAKARLLSDRDLEASRARSTTRPQPSDRTWLRSREDCLDLCGVRLSRSAPWLPPSALRSERHFEASGELRRIGRAHV